MTDLTDWMEKATAIGGITPGGYKRVAKDRYVKVTPKEHGAHKAKEEASIPKNADGSVDLLAMFESPSLSEKALKDQFDPINATVQMAAMLKSKASAKDVIDVLDDVPDGSTLNLKFRQKRSIGHSDSESAGEQAPQDFKVTKLRTGSWKIHVPKEKEKDWTKDRVKTAKELGEWLARDWFVGSKIEPAIDAKDVKDAGKELVSKIKSSVLGVDLEFSHGPEKTVEMFSKLKEKKGLQSAHAWLASVISDKKTGKFLNNPAMRGSKRQLLNAVMEKSIPANLEDWMQKSDATPDTLSKSMYVDDWAMQFGGTGMHVEALQCLKDMRVCAKERDKFRASRKSWRDEDDLPRSSREAYRKKRQAARDVLDQKENGIRVRMSGLEEKLLDKRIKDAKSSEGMYKSDGETEKSMYNDLNDFLEKGGTPVGGTTPGGYKKVAEGQYMKEGGDKDKGKGDAGAEAMKQKPSEKHDPETVRELELYAENNGDLYRQRLQPIHKNLMAKIAKGTYDHEKAKKLWLYAAADAAQRYTKEFDASSGGMHGSHGAFSPADRRALAARLADDFKDEADLGNYDNLIPKKYQKGKLDQQVNDHLEARWKLMGEKGQQGKVTKDQYFSANKKSVAENIKEGLVPSGKGTYKKSLQDFVDEDWMNKAWEADMETIEEYLEKAGKGAGLPTHQQGLGHSKSSTVEGGSADGGSLDGTGKTSGSSDSSAGPGQDTDGQLTGVPAAKKVSLSEDDAGPDGQMKPHKKPIESVKKSAFPADQRDSVAQERAAVVSQLNKSNDVYVGPDNHPFSEHAMHATGDEDAAALVKSEEFYHGGSPQVAPNRAVIDSGVLCKSVNANGCDSRYSAALTACPDCGAGTVGHRHMPNGPVVGAEQQILEKSEGPGSLLRRPAMEPDVKIGE